MNASHQLGGSGQSSPFISSPSLIAGLSGLKAALTSTANQHSQGFFSIIIISGKMVESPRKGMAEEI
jgi:hypothetical protein